jgi:hypothetical protein
MQARSSDGAQSLPSNGVPGRHKDAYGGAEQIFEVSASIGHPLREIIGTGELRSTV